MDKTEEEFIKKNMNTTFELGDIGLYAFIIGICILVFTLGKFMKKKINSYLNHRKKLIELSEEYERKRNGRKESGNENMNSKQIEYFHSNDIKVDFSKYISKFCTIYLDFDNHSEDYKSYFVNIKKYINKKLIFFSNIF